MAPEFEPQRRWWTALVLAVVIAALAAPAVAARAALRVSPTYPRRGTVVTVSGSGCLPGDAVFLISRLFPGHAYGIGAISARVRAGGRFLRRFHIPAATPRRRYTITARCGGGNLGVAAHLRVR